MLLSVQKKVQIKFTEEAKDREIVDVIFIFCIQYLVSISSIYSFNTQQRKSMLGCHRLDLSIHTIITFSYFRYIYLVTTTTLVFQNDEKNNVKFAFPHFTDSSSWALRASTSENIQPPPTTSKAATTPTSVPTSNATPASAALVRLPRPEPGHGQPLRGHAAEDERAAADRHLHLRPVTK